MRGFAQRYCWAGRWHSSRLLVRGAFSVEMTKCSCVARFQCGACTESQVDPTYFLSRVVGNRKQSKRQGTSGEDARSGVDLNI